MSSKTVCPSSDEDASLEGPDARSAPCDLIDSTYSVLGSFIADKNEGVEEAHTDNDQPEEDDGVDVIDEESVNENQGILEGMHPRIYQSAEEQPVCTQIAESGDLRKSSSGNDTTANKSGLPNIVAQAPLDMKMVFFIISSLLLAGYMQYHIDCVLQEYNEYRSETQDIIKAMQDDHNKYKLESQNTMKTIQDVLGKYKSENQDMIKTMQDDLKQEHHRNDLLSQKMESMYSQLQQFQHGGLATMSAFIKNQIEMQTNLCPVFVEIIQMVEFLVQTGDHHDVIQSCGEVIWGCLEDGKVEIELFLESDGLRLLERISAQGQNIDHWQDVMELLFFRWNEVQCTQEYVGHLLQLLDSSHNEDMAVDASGILCKCLDDDDVWDANTKPTKHQVSEAVSKAIETWQKTYTFGLWYINEASLVTWVKQSSATAQQHLAVWILFNFNDTERKHMISAIGEVILEEILKDPRPHPHTKDLVRKILLK